MLVRVARGVLVLVMSMVAMAAHAVTYNINTTLDGPVAVDGQCTIREAVQAATTQTDVGDCVAGTGLDRLVLEPGQVYVLDQGEMQVGGGGENVNLRVLVPDPENDDPAVIDMFNNSRAFTVAVGSGLVLDGVSLRNGAPATGDGGLVNSSGGFEMRNGSVLEGGQAGNGGLIAATGSVRVLSGSRLIGGNASGNGGAVYLHGAADLTVVDSRIGGTGAERNIAAENGGAVALASDFDGELIMENALLDNNEATNGHGGALFFQGDRVHFGFVNISLLGNEASQGTGALHVGNVNLDQDIEINNMTVADSLSGNDGVNTYGSVHVTAADSDDTLYNSIIVGDRSGTNCSGAMANGFSNDANDSDNIVLAHGVVGAGCRTTGDGVNGATMFAGDMRSLRGVDSLGNIGGCGAALTSSQICDPIDFEPFPGYLPVLTDSGAAPWSPWNRGNPDEGVVGSCQSTDQRGKSRLENRCDMGALEFAVASGEDDEFTVVQGRTVSLDMGENDLGDGIIDCRRSAVAANPLAPFLLDHQSNGLPSEDTDRDNDDVDDGLETQPFDADDCAQILIPPSRPGAVARFVEDPDKPGSLLLEYTPGSTYHGLDEVAYRINRAAFEPTWVTNFYATRANRNVEGVVFIISEPASGLKEAETINQLGATGGLSLFVLVVLGLIRRRACRSAAALLLLAAAGTAGAAEIEVTTLEDNFVPNDGFCSVREALYSSIDELVNLEKACNNGQGGQDTVLLPRGCIQLDPGAGPLIVESSVVIEGQAVHGLDAGALPAVADYYNSTQPGSTTCRTDDSWTEGSIIVGDQEQIIDAQAQLQLRSLSLFGGRSAGNGGALRSAAGLSIEQVEFYDNIAANLGGAIFMSGVTDDSQGARIVNAYFLNNLAKRSGGAISLSGGSSYEILIGDSTFEGNAAEQTGGAMLVNPGGGFVRFANVLVTGNLAGTGGAGLDISQSLGTVDVLNSTILNNTGGNNGGLDGGVITTNRTVRMTNSVYALNYIWDSPARGNIYDPADPTKLYDPTTNARSRTLNGDCSSTGTGPADSALRQSRNNLYSSAVVLADECPSGERAGDEQPVGNDENDVKGEYETNGFGELFTAPNVPAGDPVFIPPNLLVLNTSTLIKDKGFDGTDPLASGYDSPNKCRAEDQRGLPRTSGQRCDRGAFEVQETTAIDDSVNNKGSSRAGLLIDVLKNDSTDPSKTIPPENVNVVTLPANAGWAMVLRTDPDVACTPSEPGYGDGCLLRYDPEDTTPLNPDDAVTSETNFGCIAAGSPVTQTLTYNFQDSSGVVSNNADIVVTLNNLPPRIDNEEVFNEPGGTVVIKLDVDDPFGYNGPVDMSTLSLEKDPLFAAEDEFGNVEGVGVKLNVPAPGYVTYVAGDTTKRFKDTFKLSVLDDCGTKSVGGSITIRYENEDVSGGDLLAGGASVTPFALLLLVGGFRRRVRR